MHSVKRIAFALFSDPTYGLMASLKVLVAAVMMLVLLILYLKKNYKSQIENVEHHLKTKLIRKTQKPYIESYQKSLSKPAPKLIEEDTVLRIKSLWGDLCDVNKCWN